MLSIEQRMSLDGEKETMQEVFFLGPHIEEEEKATATRAANTHDSAERDEPRARRETPHRNHEVRL